MKHVTAIVAGLFVSASAFAEPLGTPLQMQVSHSGPFGEVQNFVHVYGGVNQVFDSFGFNYLVASPANVPGWDNSIRLDFTNFAYADFAGEAGRVVITGFALPVTGASVLNGAGAPIGATASGAGFIDGTWSVNDVLATNNIMFVAWNKIPTPGAVAVFGLAGLAAARRRR